MQNVIKAKREVSKEELTKIEEMDWNTYYRESASADTKGLTNCPKCKCIVVVDDGQADATCYNCGEKIPS